MTERRTIATRARSQALRRRVGQLMSASLVAMALLAAPLPAAAAWPEHPINIVVPFTAGGGPDLIARTLSESLSKDLKQPAIVVNRDGAGTVIGVNAVAKAPADGYTLLVSGDAGSVNTASGRKLPYDLLRDLKPVTLLFSSTQFLIVRSADKRFQTVADLVREGKAHPGALKYGSAAVGTSLHMSGEIFNRAAGLDAIHVPYRGVSKAMADLASGQIDYMIAGASSALPQMKGGLFRMLAVTSNKRSPEAPDVPTLDEQGIAAETSSWYALFVPAATPAAIVQQLNAAVTKILASKEMTERMHSLGGEARPTTPEQAEAFVKADIEKFRNLIRERHLQLEN